GEDYEWALRAQRLGYRFCYEPRCEMIHDHRYDPEYDAVRGDIARQLASHLAIWDLHRKLSLSPYSLHFLRYLLARNEALFLPAAGRWTISGITRRVERRLLQQLFHLRYADTWTSADDGERATDTLRSVLTGSAGGESAVTSRAGNWQAPAHVSLSRRA